MVSEPLGFCLFSLCRPLSSLSSFPPSFPLFLFPSIFLNTDGPRLPGLFFPGPFRSPERWLGLVAAEGWEGWVGFAAAPQARGLLCLFCFFLLF